ncbi:HAD-IIIC family phosphatase [Kitasatospora sp. NPDC059571]|uniref:HAD-IIIC family phosphatase n=1 Tax=Kitasatospora sp. NPDC059571 TaxID=3346871 RepID=UPI0036B4B40F
MTAEPDRLRTLVEQGRAAAEYPAVAGLLAAASRTDLPRAGRLLARVDPDEVRRHHPGVRAITAVVTGSGTVAGLVPPLTAELARGGLLLAPVLTDFDRWAEDLADTAGPAYADGTDVVLCVLDAEAVLAALPAPWRVEDAERAAADTLARLDALAGRYTAHGTGTLVLNTVPLLRSHTHQLIDHASRARFGILWREFNIGLLRLAARHERVAVVDLDPLVAEGGPVRDPRLAAYAQARLGDDLLGRYAREVAHLVRSRCGLARKALVVDLDRTLWDGVLGEDGPDGIAAAGTLRGQAFGRFQRIVAQLGSQGVLLAVSSKNDRQPVLDVLRDHPDLVLRTDDFVRIAADWRPKAEHLKELAADLRLGTDAFVFVDDSPVECALVAAELPEVAVVPLTGEPAEHVERLLADGWFDVPALTAEDRARAGDYRTEAARRAALLPAKGAAADGGAEPTSEQLGALGMAVEVSPVRPHEIARVAQLTLRTNQFNLTGERLGAADVRAGRDDPDRQVLAVRSLDRFGDQGVVGAVFARRTADGLRIDNVLLSCRVLARGVERAVLAAVLAEARRAGLGAVDALHRPTGRNHRTADFYPSLGFRPAGEDDRGRRFRHDLAELPQPPGHIRLTAALDAVG